MKMLTDIAALRKNYALQSLSETDVLADPIQQFAFWFQEAIAGEITEPNAMTLATANREGRPSARTVLLKGFDNEGFVFFTNYQSRKATDLSENPQACLLFTWLALERQICIEGTVEKVPEEASLLYFQSRPKGSQIGAWASPQSQVVPDRAFLEKKMEMITAQYAEMEVLPRPAHWGGYRVHPLRIEFWQGRSSRLHDRIVYTRVDQSWKIERWAP
jgi:pyridoxamine 5'-phosphate oxidase